MIDGIGIGDIHKMDEGDVLLTHRTRCVNNHETIGDMCEQCDGSHSTSTQDFNDAEMVVIRKKPYSTLCNGIDGSKELYEKMFVNQFKMFAIYGNKIIESEIGGDRVHELSKKTKIIWADRKPYILNGVWMSYIFMNKLKGWTVKFIPGSTEGYCWENKKVIDIGLDNPNPLRLLLHEIAHVGINPYGNKHTQEWFDKYIALMQKYMPGVDISNSDKIIQKVYKLQGT